MRVRMLIIILIISSFAISANALEWNGKFGVGLRGPVFAPMFRGSNYTSPRGDFERYMMGLNGSLDLRYGLSKQLVLNLTAGYASTYDDSTASADQTFKMNSSDRAYTKLNGLLLGLTGNYYFMPEGSVQPYLIFGLGMDNWSVKTQVGDSSFKVSDLNLKFGAGLNFWIGEKISIDGQIKFSKGLSNLSTDMPKGFYGSGDWSGFKDRPFGGYLEPSIGITYYFGGSRDSDKDGVKDKYDQCPDTPIGAIVDQYGCPLDTDGDGVYDGLDQCPDTPKGCIVDITGCPLDTDKDGVCDGLDKCPDTPPGIAVDVHGCPLDTDGDGVPDYKDQEPNTPKGAIVDANGVAIDSDKDGVPDGLDKCPDTPIGVAVDEFGCPKAKPFTEKLVLHITYSAGSFEPDQAAKTALDGLAETLKAFSNLKIEINGYTDALGSERSNLKVSQTRASAIMDYLASKGVPAERMTAKGYGEDPKFFIADNATPDGRAQNRRIEIVPVQQ